MTFTNIRLSFEKVTFELGNYQSYQLRPLHDIAVVELSIERQPNLTMENEAEANSDCIELVNSVNQFIEEAVKQNMRAVFSKFPIQCYIPCTECGKLHIKYEKATKSKNVLCNSKGTYCDITLYHKMLSGNYNNNKSSIEHIPHVQNQIL